MKMLPTNFQINWPFDSGKYAKEKSFKMTTWRPSCISDLNNLSYFRSASHPNASLPSFKLIGLSVLKKKQKIDFQDGCHGSHLGFPIGTILALFDLQVTQMLPT